MFTCSKEEGKAILFAKDTESHKDKRFPKKMKRSKFGTSKESNFSIQRSLNLQNLGGLCLSANTRFYSPKYN